MKMKTTFNLQRPTLNAQRRAQPFPSALGVECSMFDVSPSVTRHSQRGIALVITLIMLAVTLVMAVAFLAIARRERNAATTATDTAVARLADDAALAAAQAQIAANILATTNPYNYSLLVSTNYQNGAGFFTGVASPTNVNYDFYNGTGLGPVSGNDLVQNIANLYLLPRAPVFVNNPNTGLNDFRFYLDLNRNGAFDPNGSVTNVDNLGNAILGANGSPLVTVQGDPEWIGVLEHPDQPHGPNNPFVARYAFLAQPAGNSLDLNYIHNQTLNTSLGVQDGFFRNESVGSWELNLAAFLTDLNTNQWGQDVGATANFYQYNRAVGSFNFGDAFDDSRALLSWRYAYNYNSLAVPFGNFYTALANGNVDDYTLGYLMTNTALPAVFTPNNAPWAGSDNTNRYFALPSDVFDPTKNLGNFPVRLAAAGKSVATYDRYTYYRMLDELGTDSTADDSRMNLNYSNAVVTYNGSGMMTSVTIIPGAETNATPWRPLDFFNAAADRMLRYYTANWASANFGAFTNTFGASVTGAFGVASIPVYINGQMVYSPAVNRILQLAANMYDATTNQTAALGRDYPSVFRPTFWVTNQNGFNNVYINGYSYVGTVAGAADPNYFLQPADVSTVAAANLGTVQPNVNIYGVPWIVGAKKGYPNFNEFAMENTLAITRRLQLTRTTNNSAVQMTGTNQMYTMGLNSSIGIEFWNSYISNYSGTIWVGVSEHASLSITNDDSGFNVHPGTPVPNYFDTNIVYAVSNWTGSGTGLASGNLNTNAFMVASYVGPTMPISAYRSPSATAANLVNGLVAPCFMNTNYFGYLAPSAIYETNTANGFHFPQFGVVLTNRLQVFMLAVDSGGTRVIDYASFAGPDGGFNVNSNLADADGASGVNLTTGGGVWSTNYPNGSSAPNGVTWGILNQISAAKNLYVPTPDGGGTWKADPEARALGTTAGSQAANFTAFFKAGFNLPLSVQAPFTPTRNVVQYLLWQANDPLVHYLASDLVSTVPMPTTGLFPQPGLNSYNPGQTLTPLTSLMGQQLNDNFMPWGGNPKYKNNVVSGFILTNKYNLEIKDPSVAQSDNWDFPNYKFPTVGWLGRVHRGTPWQTVYLKASDITANNNYLPWQQWTGDQNIFDATNAAPVQDAGLFDLFSTAPNGNATHGTLSVNQVHLAAWSAVFSGLVVTNSISGGYTNIPPAGPDSVNSAVALLVNGTQGINATRANTSLFPLGAFTHIGDILRTPALTEQSPFLNWSDPAQQQSGISDELYEWLPQQTLGLLRLSSTPRYVVYCYGQTLRPAPNSVVTSSSLLPSGMNPFGLVTNYQITAESAARAVIRVDNATTKAPRVVVESYVPLPPK
jgi:hypothetical protein